MFLYGLRVGAASFRAGGCWFLRGGGLLDFTHEQMDLLGACLTTAAFPACQAFKLTRPPRQGLCLLN